MKFGWRIILVVIVVIIALVVILVGLNKKVEPASSNLTGIPSAETINLPKATGNIDDVVNSLILGADAESTIIYRDSTDVSSINYDDAEISNFGQSYENNFQ